MASPARSAAQVVVALSGHSKEDADAVFGVLHACYPSGPASDAPPPREEAEGHPTVWSATFEVSGARQEPAPTSLGAPLTADLQGGPARWNSCATSWPPPSPYRTRAGRPVTRSANCTCGWRAARALYFLAPARRNAHSMRGSTTPRRTRRTGAVHSTVIMATAAAVTASSPSGVCSHG